MTTRPENPSWTLKPEHAATLESLLRELASHHETVLEVCRAHRAALAGADHHAIGACVVRQQELGMRLSELDSRRMRLVATASGAGDPRAAGNRPPLRLSDLAARAAEPWRTVLLKGAMHLREMMVTASREQESLRQASESLLSHMKGLMTQVSRQLSSTGTYARTHTPPEHAQVFTGIDLTS